MQNKNLYYALEENVYLVDGYKNSCLYDMNSLNLYLLNDELRNWLKKFLSKEFFNKSLTEEQSAFLKQFVNLQLIRKCENQKQVFSSVIPRKSPLINFAWIEVTTGCNLKCIHCYEKAKFSNGAEMSIKDFRKVVNQLQKNGIKKIQLIGGEPFVLQDKLLEMIKIAQNKFDVIEIFTNGTLLTHNWVEIIKKYNIKIALSIYSYEEKEHDKVTGVSGSCKETNKAIQLLSENGIKYRVCNVLMNGISIGNKNTILYSLNPNKDIVRITGRADIRLLNQELVQKKLITKNTFSKKINKNLFERLQSGHNCFSNKIYIAYDLKVYPCVMERRFCHGTLQTNELNHILDQQILSMDKNKIEVCKDCEYRYACFDCRPNTMSKNVLSKPWYCTYNPYTGIWNDPDIQIKEIFSLFD